MSDELTVEKILENPNAFGIPTFEQFAKNPEAWSKKISDVFDLADNSSKMKQVRDTIGHQFYFVDGYKCKTLEEAERVCADIGWKLEHLEMRPQVIPDVMGKCDMHIHFAIKKEFKSLYEKSLA